MLETIRPEAKEYPTVQNVVQKKEHPTETVESMFSQDALLNRHSIVGEEEAHVLSKEVEKNKLNPSKISHNIGNELHKKFPQHFPTQKNNRVATKMMRRENILSDKSDSPNKNSFAPVQTVVKTAFKIIFFPFTAIFYLFSFLFDDSNDILKSEVKIQKQIEQHQAPSRKIENPLPIVEFTNKKNTISDQVDTVDGFDQRLELDKISAENDDLHTKESTDLRSYEYVGTNDLFAGLPPLFMDTLEINTTLVRYATFRNMRHCPVYKSDPQSTETTPKINPIGDTHGASAFYLFNLISTCLKRPADNEDIKKIATKYELISLKNMLIAERNGLKNIKFSEIDIANVKNIYAKITKLVNDGQAETIFDKQLLAKELSVGDTIFDRKMAPKLLIPLLELRIALMEQGLIPRQILGNHDLVNEYTIMKLTQQNHAQFIAQDFKDVFFSGQKHLESLIVEGFNDQGKKLLDCINTYISLCDFVSFKDNVWYSHAGITTFKNKQNMGSYLGEEFTLDEAGCKSLNERLHQKFKDDPTDFMTNLFTKFRPRRNEEAQERLNTKIMQVFGHDGRSGIDSEAKLICLNGGYADKQDTMPTPRVGIC